MVTPAARRSAVAHAVEVHGLSERRACAIISADRSSVPYRSVRPDDAALWARLRDLADQRRRSGYRRLHVLLRQEGHVVNRKKTQRLYREEGLAVRRRKSRRRIAIETLFHPTLRNGKLADRHVNKLVRDGVPGHEVRAYPVGKDSKSVVKLVQYGFRSFDQQWIIPDNRLISFARRELWAAHSDKQVYLTSPEDRTPENVPPITFTALIPDLHYYYGWGRPRVPLT